MKGRKSVERGYVIRHENGRWNMPAFSQPTADLSGMAPG